MINNTFNITNATNIFICGDYAPSKSFNAKQILKFIKEDDFLIINYEGVAQGVDSKLKNFDYYTPLINNDFLSFLVSKKIRVLANFCNNHTFDYGTEGLNYTIRKLKEIGVFCFGLNYPGIVHKIKFVDNQNNINEINSLIDYKLINHYRKFNYQKFFNTFKNIFKMKLEKFSTIYFHGGIEFINYPNYFLYKKLKYLNEKNINCFVSHQHVPLLLSNDRSICCFGLGNLVFDCKNHNHTSLTRNSYVFKLNSNFKLSDIYLSNFQYRVLNFEKYPNLNNHFPRFSLSKWSKECYLLKQRKNAFYNRSKSHKIIKNQFLKEFKIIIYRLISIKKNFEYYCGIFFYSLIRFFK